MIIVVINEIIKKPVYMGEKNRYGSEKKLRVKGTSSHFTPTRFRTRIFVCFSTRILAFFSVFIFWYRSLRKVANATGETKPGY